MVAPCPIVVDHEGAYQARAPLGGCVPHVNLKPAFTVPIIGIRAGSQRVSSPRSRADRVDRAPVSPGCAVSLEVAGGPLLEPGIAFAVHDKVVPAAAAPQRPLAPGRLGAAASAWPRSPAHDDLASRERTARARTFSSCVRTRRGRGAPSTSTPRSTGLFVINQITA